MPARISRAPVAIVRRGTTFRSDCTYGARLIWRLGRLNSQSRWRIRSLDPSYPASRISMLLEDSGASLMVTQQCLAAKILRPWTSVVSRPEGLNGARCPCVPTNTKSTIWRIILHQDPPVGLAPRQSAEPGFLASGKLNITPTTSHIVCRPGFDASVWS